jgi:S1-C subfamily serine protease
MGYAIPSHVAKPILERIMQQSTEPRRPMIGISIDNWSESLADNLIQSLLRQGYGHDEIIVPQQGVMVSTVHRDRPAYEAGMQLFDIIIAIDGVPVSSVDQLIEMMYSYSVGDEVVYSIVRDGTQALKIAVILGPYLNITF